MPAGIEGFDRGFVFVCPHVGFAQFLVEFLGMMNPLGGFADLVPGMQIGTTELDDTDDRQHDGKQPGRTAAKQHS